MMMCRRTIFVHWSKPSRVVRALDFWFGRHCVAFLTSKQARYDGTNHILLVAVHKRF